MPQTPDQPPLHDRHAGLETQLIRDYIRDQKQDPGEIMTRTDEQAMALRRAAARYASGRLAEVQSRSHLIHDIAGK